METFLEFEKPILSLEKKLNDLRSLANQGSVNLDKEIHAMEKKVQILVNETYSKLTPWQRVQLSRHPSRPHTSDYIEKLFPDFLEVHGDRSFGDDPAIIAGVANWSPNGSIAIIGHQKGRTTREKMERNFGMARPEGYRKAIRLMNLAEKARLPVLTFIDTPGAHSGMEAEDRGQSQAIAECMRTMFSLTVPIISIVIGEGGSGGALAIGAANRVLMLEYSIFSVISPEGCASILWNEAKFAEKASDCLKLTPDDLLKYGAIDEIISEPMGGAHRDADKTFASVKTALTKHMKLLSDPKKIKNLRNERINKFRAIGNIAMEHIKGETTHS